MKRTLLSVILVLALLLCAGCGSGAPSSAPTGSDPVSSGAASSGTASSGDSSAGTSGDASGTTIPEFEMPNYSIGLLDNGFFEGVTARDIVTLPKLEGIVVPKDVQTVTDEDLQAEIDAILQNYADDGKIYDRAVENGDWVSIDYVGSIDGVEFAGGNTQGQGTLVMAGGTNYIDDFLTQIIGAKPGDTVKVEVTFPNPYENNPDLSGKDAVFETVINYIQGEVVVPELTEELIATHIFADYGYVSVEDMKLELRDMLREDQIRTHVIEWLQMSSSVAEVPEKLIEDQNQLLKNQLCNTASESGVPLSVVLSYYGMASLEDAYADAREEIILQCNQYLICQAAAEQLGIDIQEADIAEFFKEVIGRDAYTVYIEFYGQGYISQDVFVYRLADYLMEYAVME